MDESDFTGLAFARLERAEELLEEAELLLDNQSYKSANNRAYYAIEKSLLALLALKQVHIKSHKGCLRQFNMLYVNTEEKSFSVDDYKIAARAEQVRTASDYDDFYVVSKQVTVEQVKSAKILYDKVKKYIEQNE